MKATLAIAVFLTAGPFNSETANRAVSRYETSIKSASKRYYDSEADARKKLLRSLDSALSSATKAGDAADVAKLKAEIAKYSGPADPQAPPAIARPEGTYAVIFPGGKATPYVFPKTSTVYVGNAKCRMDDRNGDLWLDMGDNDTNRISVSGNRLFVEHWRGSSKGYPSSIGIGLRVK